MKDGVKKVTIEIECVSLKDAAELLRKINYIDLKVERKISNGGATAKIKSKQYTSLEPQRTEIINGKLCAIFKSRL